MGGKPNQARRSHFENTHASPSMYLDDVLPKHLLKRPIPQPTWKTPAVQSEDEHLDCSVVSSSGLSKERLSQIIFYPHDHHSYQQLSPPPSSSRIFFWVLVHCTLILFFCHGVYMYLSFYYDSHNTYVYEQAKLSERVCQDALIFNIGTQECSDVFLWARKPYWVNIFRLVALDHIEHFLQLQNNVLLGPASICGTWCAHKLRSIVELFFGFSYLILVVATMMGGLFLFSTLQTVVKPLRKKWASST